MPNPKGNPGNKGGGRKSAYQEKADAESLHRALFNKHNQEELESTIRSGEFSLWDRIILNGMEGDTKILNNLTNKAFPDKFEVESDKIIKVE